MTDTLLYTIVLSDVNQQSISSSQRKRVSSQTSLSTDFGNVEETGSEPGTRPINGAVKGLYADIITKQLEELAQASDYGAVPLFTDDSDPQNDGYFTVETFTRNPANPRVGNLWQYDGVLTKKGTRRSHYRAVDTTPVSVDNPFGAGGTDLIAVPTTATKVRWYDEKGQSSESATVQSTLAGEYADVDTFSPDEPSFDDPTLIAKIPYTDEGKADARVWDDFDRSKFDSNGINSWQKVFATDHNFDGNAVIENGLLRMTMDEDGESLTFEEWDDGTTSYSTVSQGTSDWVLTEYNFTRISPSIVEGQMRFRNTSSGSFHTLDYQVNRASNRVLFITPTNEGSIPAGLSTKLSPIAEDWASSTQAVQKIISRTEVNN